MTEDVNRSVASALADLRHCFAVGSLSRHDSGLVSRAIRTLESVSSGNPVEAWHWVYAPESGREKGGRLNLTNARGQVAATVFLFPNDSRQFKHVWFVWNERGTGGENSAEPTVDLAIREAEAAVRRWGQFDFTECAK